MRIGVLKETKPFEKRVALTPEITKKLSDLSCEILIETRAGEAANFNDAAYKEAGASICPRKDVYKKSDLLLMVQGPLFNADYTLPKEETFFQAGQTLIGNFSVLSAPKKLSYYAQQNLNCLALDLMPRITRAQSMDILSSQSNLIGYRSVIDAAYSYGKVFPMMMTAAGTIYPAKVLILGCGVAGLQAIATAKRLGAVVKAFDVRHAAKEQVESLGATFIEVPALKDAETKGGYAKELSTEDKKNQEACLHKHIKESDIIITTALIPGKVAPRLISKAMLRDMKPGSVIIDLAVESGGNVEGSVLGEEVVHNNTLIIGPANAASRLATEASTLFARNIFQFLQTFYNVEKKTFVLNTFEDQILKDTMIVYEGKIRQEAAAYNLIESSLQEVGQKQHAKSKEDPNNLNSMDRSVKKSPRAARKVSQKPKK